MKISGQGIIISRRVFEENAGIITIFSNEHGSVSGIVKNLSSRNRPDFYQVGNLVDFAWNARLSSHIGLLRCELVKSYFALIMYDKDKLYSANSVFEIMSIALKPREIHENLYKNFIIYMDRLLEYPYSFLDYIKFELCLLAEIGYGLDLSKCSVSGSKENLFYVSPKTGRAVTEESAGEYASRLLKLPSFIANESAPRSSKEVTEALDLTGYFFKRYIFRDGKEPNYRRMLAKLTVCEV